jgi:hypothetical protein
MRFWSAAAMPMRTHAEGHLAIRAAHKDIDLALFARVLRRVVEQIPDGARQRLGVGVNGVLAGLDRASQSEAAALDFLELVDNVEDERAGIDA